MDGLSNPEVIVRFHFPVPSTPAKAPWLCSPESFLLAHGLDQASCGLHLATKSCQPESDASRPMFTSVGDADTAVVQSLVEGIDA